ncbi:hypothetical protein LEP1GSC016_3951 [Leptospira borgpetersenii serovar Hardjo-bovis str. Sponselee]|uniref:Uncharacterized protein n=1 Tax=Leptospira borgpetersenii serovar Hardjo-bovis str. Sponselee TaxID=1303729 RepID=M6BUP3_LEPBO|nr:hypothetical protein LEP1GSC016_3951 [Leptospira borgpetersenii serovar Hardjo-bovis str. Sponselee]
MISLDMDRFIILTPNKIANREHSTENIHKSQETKCLITLKFRKFKLGKLSTPEEIQQ